MKRDYLTIYLYLLTAVATPAMLFSLTPYYGSPAEMGCCWLIAICALVYFPYLAWVEWQNGIRS